MNKRIQFDIPESKLKQLDELKEVLGLDTRKELLNNALTLLQWAAYEVAQGKEIMSRKDTEYSVIQLPAFMHIRGSQLSNQ